MRNILSNLVVVFVVAAFSFAREVPVKNRIDTIVQREFPSLEQIYKQIHAAPELSLQESKTAACVAEELRKAGFDVTEKFGGFGVVGIMKNGPGKTVLVREDMDALPIHEETGADYASKVRATDSSGNEVSVMHACGHDIHTACLIGTARTLAALKDQWKGTVILIGQPAEEVGRGARGMLAAGLFTKFPRPDYAISLHCNSTMEVGKVGFVSGYALANVDGVEITVRGVGGHGAHPDRTKDPIVLASQIVLALQTIVSRELTSSDPAVVTVGSIHGGTKSNVIPDEVKLQLTVRTYKDETRKHVLASIERIAKGQAQSMGVPEDREPIVRVGADYTPSTYNTPALVERVVEVFRKTVGDDKVVKCSPSMGGEDFGRFGREEPRIPIFQYHLGTVSHEKIVAAKGEESALPGLHSSKYLPERSSIKTGVQTMTAAVLSLLNE